MQFSDDLILKYSDGKDLDMEKLNYGLEGLYLSITKIIILLFISILLNMTKEFILVLLFFNIIRYFAFGFHASNSKQCLLISTFNFIVIPFFAKYLVFNQQFYIISCVLCIINNCLFAPADTIKRPLPNKKKRIIRRTISVTISIIYSLIIIFSNLDISKTIFLGLFIECIIISPITYKIFSSPYNNYKNLT